MKLVLVLVLMPLGVVAFYLLGGTILKVFGKTYSVNSLDILRILLTGCLPYAINIMYASAMMVRKNVRKVILIYGGIAWITVVLSYVLIGFFGVVGVGYAWVVGNFVVLVFVLFDYSLR